MPALACALNFRYAGWLLAALLVGGACHEPETLQNHLGLAGFAAYQILRSSRHQKWAWPVLRFLVGADLVHVGLAEKLLDPSLSVAFLQKFHWNFVSALGFKGFTDLAFALAAGTAEVVVGGLLAVGAFPAWTAAAVLGELPVTFPRLVPLALRQPAPAVR